MTRVDATLAASSVGSGLIGRNSYHFGMKATISEKGQVTIPKALRDSLALTPGTTLDFEEREGVLVGHRVTDPDPMSRLSVSYRAQMWTSPLAIYADQDGPQRSTRHNDGRCLVPRTIIPELRQPTSGNALYVFVLPERTAS